jgi:hypothetical protein
MLNKTTYDTALGIYAIVPPAMMLALLKMDAPYGKYSHMIMTTC